MTMTPASPPSAHTVEVDVKSAWLSKINWAQFVGIGASVAVILTGGKINLDLAQQGEIVVAIQVIVGLVTWALKTFGHPTVSVSQATKLINNS